MKREKKIKVVEKYPGKRRAEPLVWFESRKRLRNADFHRIEKNPEHEVLTPFELEVKEELASVASPYDELARIEAEDELAEEERSRHARLGHLAAKARLTPLQRSCYELVYVERITEERAQKRLGITQSRLAHLKASIDAAILKALQSENRGGKSGRIRRPLTAYQRRIAQMYEKQGLGFSQIAQRLGVAKETIFKIYQRMQKNIL